MNLLLRLIYWILQFLRPQKRKDCLCTEIDEPITTEIDELIEAG